MSGPFIAHLLAPDDTLQESATALASDIRVSLISFPTVDALLGTLDPEAPACIIANVDPIDGRPTDMIEQLILRDVTLPIIAVATDMDIPAVVDAMKGGAIDFLRAPIDIDRLSAAILEAKSVDAERRARRARRNELEKKLAALTRREVEIVRMVASGMSNKQIAVKLSRSDKTIEVHRHNAMKKLGAQSLAYLIGFVTELDRLQSGQKAIG